MAERAILHVDMDAFYASVEQRDEPEYRGKPVIVGGLGRRGVVCAASYEARKYGVHSAQPMSRARGLCPEGIYVRPRMGHYRQISRQVFAVFRRYTPLVEGLSLDEAFLDVSESRRLFGDMREIAACIVGDIRESTSLTASVGMAPNKFLAKLASYLAKPAGFVWVDPDKVQAFLDPLPVSHIWGIGPRSREKLHEARITIIAELRKAPESQLDSLFGRHARRYRDLAEGRDDRPVVPGAEEKSMSQECTYEVDVADLDRLHRELLGFAENVATRLRRAGLRARTVSVKIREPDFHTHTRSRSLDHATCDTDLLYRTGRDLLDRWWDEHPDTRVRLLGLGASMLSGEDQAELFQSGAATGEVDRIVDEVREKFGGEALKRGKLINQ